MAKKKTTSIKIIVKTIISSERNDWFWSKLEPFFASSSLRKQFPYLMLDKEDVVFIALSDEEVLGFCSGRLFKEHIYLDNVVIESKFERLAILSKLLTVFMKYYQQEKYIRIETQDKALNDYFLSKNYSIYRKASTWYFLEGPILKESEI